MTRHLGLFIAVPLLVAGCGARSPSPHQSQPQSPSAGTSGPSALGEASGGLTVSETPWWQQPVPPTAPTGPISLPADILFATGHATLTPAAEADLSVILQLIAEAHPARIIIIGRTDTDGPPGPLFVRIAYNQNLSELRAASVARYLEANGVPSSRIRAIGYGQTHPLAPENDAAGKAANRVVTIQLERPRR